MMTMTENATRKEKGIMLFKKKEMSEEKEKAYTKDFFDLVCPTIIKFNTLYTTPFLNFVPKGRTPAAST